MRAYILTKRERQIIRRYLETGEKLDGFAVLLHYLKGNSRDTVKEDLELIQHFLKKEGG